MTRDVVTTERPRGFRRRLLLRLGGGGLALAGLVVLGGALAMPAKAVLGSFLLDRAFSITLESAPDAPLARPWPGADMAPIARVRFPSLDAERVVLDQASGEAMAWGAGFVRGTADLGTPGVSAIAAHRDSHFALLADLAPGDDVLLQTRDGVERRYRVETGMVVDARSWRFPALFEGPDVLALMTCWPIDDLTPGDERLVLFARQVKTSDGDLAIEAGQGTGDAGSPQALSEERS